jgi:phosphoribosyl-ATP pyrophosphohydrolase
MSETNKKQVEIADVTYWDLVDGNIVTNNIDWEKERKQAGFEISDVCAALNVSAEKIIEIENGTEDTDIENQLSTLYGTVKYSNAFTALYKSTLLFHQRFAPPQKPELHAATRMLSEEFYETLEAALIGTDQELCEEGADLIVTLMGVMMSRGIELTDLQNSMFKIAAKNNTKTHLTHQRNENGKIARK